MPPEPECTCPRTASSRDGVPAWNADLWSAQRAEGPRATRRCSPRATEIREHLLGPVAPRERTIPQVGAVPCAARSRSACRPEAGVPSRLRHQDARPTRRTAFSKQLASGRHRPPPAGERGPCHARDGPTAFGGAILSGSGTSLRPFGPRADRRSAFQAGAPCGSMSLRRLRPFGPRADRRSAFQAGAPSRGGAPNQKRGAGPKAGAPRGSGPDQNSMRTPTRKTRGSRIATISL